MDSRSLDKNEWKDFFNSVSRLAEDQNIELELAGLDIGDQIEEDAVPLVGLTYEERDDVLFVQSPGMTHPIRFPQEIVLTEFESCLKSISVKDRDGQVQTVSFKKPVIVEVPEGQPRQARRAEARADQSRDRI